MVFLEIGKITIKKWLSNLKNKKTRVGKKVNRICRLIVISCNPARNVDGGGNFLFLTDIEVRKRWDQKGLDTPVVDAVKDDY